MGTFIVILHVVVCLALVLVVLLQAGKGAEIGASFGGGSSQTLFGSRGAGIFLTKLTAVAGAIFMLTSLALTKIETGGLLGSSVVEEAPSKQGMPAKKPTQGGLPAVPGTPSGSPFAPQAPVPAKPEFPARQGGK